MLRQKYIITIYGYIMTKQKKEFTGSVKKSLSVLYITKNTDNIIFILKFISVVGRQRSGHYKDNEIS